MNETMKEFLYTKFKESRALPGGMLNSEEKTEYEDWLAKITKGIDDSKPAKKDRDYTHMDYDTDMIGNGYHDWDGSELELGPKNKKEKELDITTADDEN